MGENIKANDMQVGGNHYAGTYQHWDFVNDTGQHYLQGCATKYVSRWRKKNGVEDLYKARHYIAKAEELQIPARSFYVGAVIRFCEANGLTEVEADAIQNILAAEWPTARMLVLQLISVATQSHDAAADQAGSAS